MDNPITEKKFIFVPGTILCPGVTTGMANIMVTLTNSLNLLKPFTIKNFSAVKGFHSKTQGLTTVAKSNIPIATATAKKMGFASTDSSVWNWTGNLTQKSRDGAGIGLANKMLSETCRHYTILTFSHGFNVLLKTALILDEQKANKFHITLISVGAPIFPNTKTLPSCIKKAANIYSPHDSTQVGDIISGPGHKLPGRTLGHISVATDYKIEGEYVNPLYKKLDFRPHYNHNDLLGGLGLDLVIELIGRFLEETPKTKT